MLEATVRIGLVSREQMTKRKLALVCQSCVILLSLVGGCILGEMCMGVYKQGSSTGCASCTKLERGWELSAFAVQGADEQSA